MPKQPRDAKTTSAFWSWQINVPLVGIAVLATFLGVKALTLLPDAYYFGFSKIVGSHDASGFLVTPPVVDRETYGRVLEESGYSIYGGFTTDGAAGSQPRELTEVERVERVRAINEQLIAAGRHHFWTSLGLKMVPPFLVGLLMFLVWKQAALDVAPLGAGIAAFLLAWPVIVLWDRVVSFGWNDQRYLFYILYVAYFVLYYHLARLGCISANALSRRGILKAGKVEIDLGKIFSSLISTGITVAVTWLVTMSMAKA